MRSRSFDEDDQDAILAAVKYWGDLERGKHIAKSLRVNEEHDDPKILAIKAGKHRLYRLSRRR